MGRGKILKKSILALFCITGNPGGFSLYNTRLQTETAMILKKLQFGKEKGQIDYDLIRTAGQWAFQIALVCLLAFVLVLYFGQRVNNIGDSMRPAIKNGDIILVNRMIYDASKPKRGDIIVFKPNGNENAHSYIKRIIGLPGETVQIKDGKIYINGKKLREEYKTAEITEAGTAGEKLTLGGDEYFVLGDNRQNSEDSRTADVGNVRRSDIQGKAWFNLSPGKNFGFI